MKSQVYPCPGSFTGRDSHVTQICPIKCPRNLLRLGNALGFLIKEKYVIVFVPFPVFLL
jgi:hypothetical protein